VQVKGLPLSETFDPPPVSSSHVYLHKMVKQLIDSRTSQQASSKVLEAATYSSAFKVTRFGELPSFCRFPSDFQTSRNCSSLAEVASTALYFCEISTGCIAATSTKASIDFKAVEVSEDHYLVD
jgi:hypothetical protein